MGKPATKECAECHHRYPVTFMRKSQERYVSGRSGSSYSFQPGTNGRLVNNPRINSGRKYYRTRTVWTCNNCNGVAAKEENERLKQKEHREKIKKAKSEIRQNYLSEKSGQHVDAVEKTAKKLGKKIDIFQDESGFEIGLFLALVRFLFIIALLIGAAYFFVSVSEGVFDVKYLAVYMAVAVLGGWNIYLKQKWREQAVESVVDSIRGERDAALKRLDAEDLSRVEQAKASPAHNDNGGKSKSDKADIKPKIFASTEAEVENTGGEKSSERYQGTAEKRGNITSLVETQSLDDSVNGELSREEEFHKECAVKIFSYYQENKNQPLEWLIDDICKKYKDEIGVLFPQSRLRRAVKIVSLSLSTLGVFLSISILYPAVQESGVEGGVVSFVISILVFAVPPMIVYILFGRKRYKKKLKKFLIYYDDE